MPLYQLAFGNWTEGLQMLLSPARMATKGSMSVRKLAIPDGSDECESLP